MAKTTKTLHGLAIFTPSSCSFALHRDQPWPSYVWRSWCTLHLLACQVRVTVGDSGLCCCVCVTSCERWLTPLFVEEEVRYDLALKTCTRTRRVSGSIRPNTRQYIFLELIHVYVILSSLSSTLSSILATRPADWAWIRPGRLDNWNLQPPGRCFNPFTAPAYKIFGLKDARTRLQTVYFPVLWYLFFQCYEFWWKSFHTPMRKRKQNA